MLGAKLACVHRAGIPMIKAVAEAESPRGPFDATGRPEILFERHYVKRVVLIVAVPALFAACTSAEVAGAGLCASSETTFFACQTRQDKWISVCGSLPRTLQYRYGTSDRPELSFPQDASAGTQKLLYAHYFRAQTDRTEVTFNNGAVDYAVFDYTEDGTRIAGVRVTPSAGKETQVVCRGPVTSRLAQLKGALKCDPDNALNGSGCR